ncbi:MAG TPA: hypothetical protein VGI45_11275 [Terracidiphilus sp.]|jgi:hypothetical protein
MKYFNLRAPDTERLWADHNKSSGEKTRVPCSVNPQHMGWNLRTSPLYLEVKHNSRKELMIWAWGVAIHNDLAEQFKNEGFTGYQLKPAIVRFRDGTTSSAYQELVVTGWAGMVSRLSGMEMTESCRGCHYRRYSAVKNYDNIIDWQQWSGEDFFYVYPFLAWRLCTERVAQFLIGHKVKSSWIEEGFDALRRDSILSKYDVPVGDLNNFLPHDLAAKYGKQIGLERDALLKT